MRVSTEATTDGGGTFAGGVGALSCVIGPVLYDMLSRGMGGCSSRPFIHSAAATAAAPVPAVAAAPTRNCLRVSGITSSQCSLFYSCHGARGCEVSGRKTLIRD